MDCRASEGAMGEAKRAEDDGLGDLMTSPAERDGCWAAGVAEDWLKVEVSCGRAPLTEKRVDLRRNMPADADRSLPTAATRAGPSDSMMVVWPWSTTRSMAPLSFCLEASGDQYLPLSAIRAGLSTSTSMCV